MVASCLNCVLKGINLKSNWPTPKFPKLETDPSVYYLGGFSSRGKGLWISQCLIGKSLN